MIKNNHPIINLCLIGAGRAGMLHALNISRYIPEGRVTAVCDPSPESLALAQSQLDLARTYTDFREAVMDPSIDAVIIVAPTSLHRDIAVAAANHGKHIFCEKPMAIHESECEAMIEAATKNQVKLQIGFMRRFDQSFMTAYQSIQAGSIGQVVMVKSLTHGPSVPQAWMYDLQKSNGPLAEVNSHDIDTLRWLAGSEVKTVHAVGGNFRCQDIALQFPDFYDSVLMDLQFSDGKLGLVDGAVSVKYGYDARVEVLGTEGVLFIGRNNADNLTIFNKNDGIHASHVQSWRNLFADAYIDEMKHFIQCIIEDRTPAVTGLDGLRAVQIVEAGNCSLREKRIVDLV